MPRQPRLDAPGALHHVMGRGIAHTKVFPGDEDRTDFVNRLAALAREGSLIVYAWALMPNHFHLLVRTGQQPLFRSMRRLLTGRRFVTRVGLPECWREYYERRVDTPGITNPRRHRLVRAF